MKNKKVKFILICLLIIGIIFLLYIKYPNNRNIPDNYIAVFRGDESSELSYSTYIYKNEDNDSKYNFKYINTTNTTVSWGNPKWQIKVTERGKVTRVEEVFEVAKKNNSYSYVLLPNDDKNYTVEEFEDILPTMILK